MTLHSIALAGLAALTLTSASAMAGQHGHHGHTGHDHGMHNHQSTTDYDSMTAYPTAAEDIVTETEEIYSDVIREKGDARFFGERSFYEERNAVIEKRTNMLEGSVELD